jgi:hypothetical protein
MIVVAEIVAGASGFKEGRWRHSLYLAAMHSHARRADRDASRRVRQATRATGCPWLQGGVHRLIASQGTAHDIALICDGDGRVCCRSMSGAAWMSGVDSDERGPGTALAGR